MKFFIAAALLVVSVTVVLGAGGGQRPASPTPTLAPLANTCPMHPDVVEARPGSCPVCKMSLVPVRLDAAYMCPVHTTVMSDREGTCRLCKRQLIPVTVSLTWTCLNQPGIDRLEPGACPDGTAMVPRRTLRAHGNHNPQHGGQFFMAPDNWHHLEGTYPRDRTFRLYLYDDFARALPQAEMTRVTASVTSGQRSVPLRLAGNGAYLEARLDAVKLPAEMTVKLRFKADAPEYPFDFTFAALTKEPASPAAARAAVPQPVAPAAPPSVEPDTISGILEQLKLRDSEVRTFIQEGNFAAVWVPAFQAKDLAVALEPHLARLPPSARAIADPAVQRVVRYAWLLDAFGDVGNRQQVESAYAGFGGAVAETVKAFAEAQ